MESLKHGILTLNFRMELANKKPIETQFCGRNGINGRNPVTLLDYICEKYGWSWSDFEFDIDLNFN